MTEQTERNGKKGFFQKYINGTKGVISLFLAILMVPFVMLAGVLIDAARIRSAVAIFDEALCNASNSTLGTYDPFLKERFGLLAMAQSSGDGSYNAQDFIEDTFTYYIQENLKTLNKAFTEYTAEAVGVYPLSEKEVLRTEILEYSKYTVPTKLIINGLSIDSLISSLTKSTSVAGKILNTISSAVTTANTYDDCQTKFDEAIKAAEACEGKLSSGKSGFSSFESAASDYNDIVTEMLEERRKAEEALRAAQNHQSACQDDFDREAAANADVLDEIADLENEKDAEGNPVDNSERIAEIREAHKEELEAYDKAAESLEDAKKSTSGAESTLNGVKSDYAARLDSQRSVVGSSRDSYAAALGALADALERTGEAVKAAQEAMKATLEAGNKMTKDILDTAFSYSASVDKDTIDDLRKHRNEASERGDYEAVYLWEIEIEKAENASRKVNNAGDVLTSGTGAVANEFVNKNYPNEFQNAANKVRSLKAAVEAYTLASGDDYMAATTPYQLKITMPIDKKGLERVQSKIAQAMASSSLMSLLKAVFEFVDKLKKLTLLADPKLNANVNIANIRKDTTGIGASGVLDDDKTLSERYKNLYGGVASSGIGKETMLLDDAVDKLIGYIGEIKGKMDGMLSPTFKIFAFTATLLRYLPEIIDTVITIIQNIGRLGEVAYSRLLLAGYAGYNTSNRTTVGGSGLTGNSFLTAAEESNSNALFCGAETEYLITGLQDEQESQKKVFHMVYQLRMAIDIPFIFVNDEVASIASAAGAATFGVGTVIVYLLFMLMEPLVDTFLLVNKGTVPFSKMNLYLTPSGVPKLVETLLSLDIGKDNRTAVSAMSVKFMSGGTVSDEYAEKYADAIASGVSDPGAQKPSKVMQTVNFTYTKMMILLLLFRRTDETLARLADVIQMEAAYNANSGADGSGMSAGAAGAVGAVGGGGGGGSRGGSFSLNNSYTYIRASGDFSGAYAFSPDKAPWTTKEKHIVYRGY